MRSLRVRQRQQLRRALAVALDHGDERIAPRAIRATEAHQVGRVQRQPASPHLLGVRLDRTVRGAHRRRRFVLERIERALEHRCFVMELVGDEARVALGIGDRRFAGLSPTADQRFVDLV